MYCNMVRSAEQYPVFYESPPIDNDEDCVCTPIYKAAIVPFRRDSDKNIRYYVYRPQARHPELGAPTLQICKGTRQRQKKDGSWKDVKKKDFLDASITSRMESLSETALREGREEIGLAAENVRLMLDLGAASYVSASTGRTKHMQFFICTLKDDNFFLPTDPEKSGTAECRWCTLEEFLRCGRADHSRLLGQVEAFIHDHAELAG